MPYLIKADLYRLIQPDALAQITASNDAHITNSFKAAEEIVKSILRQRYDVSAEFTETLQYDKTKVYKQGDRFYLDANLFQESLSYARNDFVLFDGYIWYCNVDSWTPNPWDAAYFVKMAPQYAVYHVANPTYKPFDYTKVYAKNDKVIWQGIKYTAKQSTKGINHAQAIQYPTIADIPLNNVFPDDPIYGAGYWANDGVFSLTAGTLTTDTSGAFVPTDDRDEQIKSACANYALYDIHMRIAPKNVPMEREVRSIGQKEDRVATKDGIIYPIYSALGYVQACAMGKAMPTLPILQPDQGIRVSYGGRVKNINSY
jgi:hypothetical protein